MSDKEKQNLTLEDEEVASIETITSQAVNKVEIEKKENIALLLNSSVSTLQDLLDTRGFLQIEEQLAVVDRAVNIYNMKEKLEMEKERLEMEKKKLEIYELELHAKLNLIPAGTTFIQNNLTLSKDTPEKLLKRKQAQEKLLQAFIKN